MKRFNKILFGTIAFLAIIICIVILTSPYGRSEGFEYRLVKYTVNINTSSDSVFRFLGNSNNARRWSVFVHHISTLNADSLPDGRPGSRRRCYCKEDETGMTW